MAKKNELSLAELVHLQSNVDRKTRNKLIFHEEESPKPKVNNKRSNKNGPREESSKVPVKPVHLERSRKIQMRDPRFDSLCGTFNETFYQENYSFIDDIKKKERRELEISLKKEVNPERRKQIQFLLKRIKDQERENEKKRAKAKKRIEQSEKLKKSLMEGKPVHFRTKSEKRLTELVDKYEELKSKGKLQSYMKKKVMKVKKEDHKLPFKLQ